MSARRFTATSSSATLQHHRCVPQYAVVECTWVERREHVRRSGFARVNAPLPSPLPYAGNLRPPRLDKTDTEAPLVIGSSAITIVRLTINFPRDDARE